MTLAQLFADGSILIMLSGGCPGRIRIGIEATEHLNIRRKEIV
jgi:sRNA-binding carbon storage regulator CsrA